MGNDFITRIQPTQYFCLSPADSTKINRYRFVFTRSGNKDDPGLIACPDDCLYWYQGGPLVILYSDDLDATVVAVRSAGGTISKETFDFPGGRRFHFVDPSGNELAVWGKAAGTH